jgi:hypothetical protein
MDKSRWRAALCAISFGIFTTVTVFGQATEDQKLAVFFKDYLEKHFQQQPLDATGEGDHRWDDRLDDISATARAGRLTLTKDTLAALPRQVDYAKLSRDGQIDFEIFQHELQTQIWETKTFHPFEEDPRTYGGYISDSTYLPLTHSTLPQETNIANCIARMAELPRIVAEAEKTLTHPAKPILQTAILQNQGAIDFYQHDLFQFAGPTPQLPQLKAAASTVVASLQEYQKFLEGPLMARATGEWRIGKKKFDEKFVRETQAGLTAEQNLAEARTEFDRVRRDMYVVSRQLWCQYYPHEPLPPDDARGERETITRSMANPRIWCRTPGPRWRKSKRLSARNSMSPSPTPICAR